MEIIHCSPHTKNAVCFKSCLELQETNKLKQRKQLRESRLHEWMWPQTPQERTWRQPMTRLFCPQNRTIEQALSDSHQEILAYICFILSQHPESSFWWLTGRGRILRDALCMCSKKLRAKVLSEWWWASMSACDYLEGLEGQHEARDGQAKCEYPVWCVNTAGFKALALSTWWESRFQFYPEWTTRNTNPTSNMVYLYFSSRHTFPKLSRY